MRFDRISSQKIDSSNKSIDREKKLAYQQIIEVRKNIVRNFFEKRYPGLPNSDLDSLTSFAEKLGHNFSKIVSACDFVIKSLHPEIDIKEEIVSSNKSVSPSVFEVKHIRSQEKDERIIGEPLGVNPNNNQFISAEDLIKQIDIEIERLGGSVSKNNTSFNIEQNKGRSRH